MQTMLYCAKVKVSVTIAVQYLQNVLAVDDRSIARIQQSKSCFHLLLRGLLKACSAFQLLASFPGLLLSISWLLGSCFWLLLSSCLALY